MSDAQATFSETVHSNRELADTMNRHAIGAVRDLARMGYRIETVQVNRTRVTVVVESESLPEQGLTFRDGPDVWREAHLNGQVKVIFKKRQAEQQRAG